MRERIRKAIDNFPWYVSFIIWGGCLDSITSVIGFTRGFQEGSQLFLFFPWMSILLLSGTAYLMRNALPSAPAWLRKWLPYSLAAWSFAPGIQNIFLILTVPRRVSLI